ncbi:hypothetical protein ACOMHN_051649 [Nucella lapillus]
MSVIIRLQGLPWSASALDIRSFFRGLIIPQGGVHIIGGEKGDAFIAFSSDDDARQAMMRNSACLNGVSVQLLLSSKSEMLGIIDEARDRDSVPNVAVAPAPAMPRTKNTGMGQDYQKQPYPASQDMGNQRLPHPTNFQKPPDPNQGQFPGMQNVDRGQNQMQQFHGQQIPDRPKQFGFQGEKPQDPYKQNVPPAGKPKMGNEGQYPMAQQGYDAPSSDRNFGKDNHQQQWSAGGGYGNTMEGGFDNQNTNQWYQRGQEFGNKQNYYGDKQPLQGHGPGYQKDQPSDQYSSNVAGQDKHFQQQQQRRDLPNDADNYWQEGFNSGNRDSFPWMADQPGPQDTNRSFPGQGNVPPPMSNVEHMPPHPGPGNQNRFPGMGRPDMEQRPDMGQGRGRGPNEDYPPQAIEEQRYPPNRREGPPPARGGPEPGPFSDGPPKRGGILPTPDMANQDQQKDCNSEQLYNPEDMEQGNWPGHQEETQSYDPGRGRGQFPGGREPNSRDSSMGRGRPFDGPGNSRPRDRPRRSRFDQVDESPVERGSDGRPAERGFVGRPDERSAERGPNRRPLPEREHGRSRFDERPSRGGHDGALFEKGPDEWPGADGRNQRPFERGPGRSLERGPGGDRDNSFNRGENRGSMEKGGERPFKRGPDGRPKEGGLLGRASDNRPIPEDPEGQAGGEHEGSFEPGRRFEEPHGRFDGPPGNRFPLTEEYDPTSAEYNPEGQGNLGMRGPARRGLPGAREFGEHGRGKGDRSERGSGRWNERPRHDRGFYRGGSRGHGQSRPPFDQSEEFVQYPEEGHFDNAEEMHRNKHGGDMEPGQQFSRGEGGPRHLGRPMRGHDRTNSSRDMDRHQRGRDREEMDPHLRDRRRDQIPNEGRPAGKGLLGDSPGCLLPTPHLPSPQEIPQHRDDDFHKDRESRTHRSREDREYGRDDRSSRRSDDRHPRDRSPIRERRHERSRDRDRGEHRDRSSNRDSKGSEKSGRSDTKPEEQTKMTESKFIYAKGFPAAYTTVEIQRFFFGCELLFTGIKIVKNAHGQKTGEAYLEFPSVDQAVKAIIKNGETIFGTPVALTFTSKKDFDEKTKMPPSSAEKEKTSANSASQKDPKGSNIVLIKGLPPNIKREDLVNLFSAVKLASSGKALVIEYDDKKQATGTAHLATDSQKDFETAMGYDGHILGSKALQLSAGDQKEMDACIAKQEEVGIKAEQPSPAMDKPPAGPGIMGARPPLMGVAPKMPGRPSLFGEKPPLHVGPDGPRNGPASVFEPGMNFPRPQKEERPPLMPVPEDMPPRFHGPDDRPPRFHRPDDRPPRFQRPEDRPPRFPGPDERPPRFPGLDERPPRFPGPDERPPRFPGPDERPHRFPGPYERPPMFHGPEDRPPRIRGPGFCVQIQGLPMLATYNDIRGFFTGLNIAAYKGVQIVHDSNSKPTGEGFVEFETQEDKDEALKRDKTSLGSQIVAVKSVAKPDMIERLRNARLTSVGPPQDSPMPPHIRPRRHEGPCASVPSHLLDPRLFYVACQNFPQGVDVGDIVEFFQDYNPVPDSIRQLYADDGTSTGNAVVGFFNREEAEMVLDELNGMLFGQSMVVLQPVK